MNQLKMLVMVAMVASHTFAAPEQTVDPAVKERAAELAKQISALRAKPSESARVAAHYDELLRLPLGDEAHYRAVFDAAAFQMHTLRNREKAEPLFLDVIKFREAALKDLTGLARAKALMGVETIWRTHLRKRLEANKVAAEILSLYRAALPSLSGPERFAARAVIHTYILAMNRRQENDESRRWVAETQKEIIDYVRANAALDDAAWFKKMGDPVARLGELQTTEEGRRFALLEIADRVMAMKTTDKHLVSQKRRMAGVAANLARKCALEDLRCKAADYYRQIGDNFRLAESLYWVNRDLAGARRAFAACTNNPAASDYLAMLADEPTTAWQLDYAWQELTNWVAKISGKVPNMANYVLAAVGTDPVVGTPNFQGSEKALEAFVKKHADDFAKIKTNDGFIIAEEDGVVYIVAGRTKGVLNGVYRFLEKNSDIIWVRAIETEDGFGSVYTRNPNFKNTIKYLCDVPAYPYRYWTSNARPDQLIFQARLLNNCDTVYDANLSPKRYRLYSTYADTTAAHVFLSLESVDCYKDSDPDIFPLVAGKRNMEHDHQLCFMNPKTIDRFVTQAEKRLAGLPTRVNELHIGLGDNWNVCECEEWCKKPIVLADGRRLTSEAKNFRSTQYALFYNAVYERLKKRFPYLKPIAFDAYLFTANAPAVRIPGGGGRYCPYVKNHKWPVYDDKVNARWHETAEDFKKAGMPFTSLYEYYLCSSTPQFYHATMEVMQKDLAYYGSAMKNVYLDGGYLDGYNGLEQNGAGSVYEASAIEFWVCSRLMWDPTIDLKAARREFCRRAYHGAEKIMADYYERLAANYNDDSVGCFWNDNPVLAAKHYIVEKGLASWLRTTLAKAEAAATDPRSKELIRRHRVRMEWLVREAEKMPKKVTLSVGKDWTEVAPLTKIGAANVPANGRLKMWVKNDRKNLYLKFESTNETWRKIYDACVKDGTYGKMQNTKRAFDWCNCVELYLDGGLGASGGYYHFALSFDARRTCNVGDVQWTGDIEPIEGGIRGIICWPLADIGVDISKGNKIGAMFLGDDTAWNGGQWNSPAGFQTLQLNMD